MIGIDHDGPIVSQSDRVDLLRGGPAAARGRGSHLPVLLLAAGHPRGGGGTARPVDRGRVPRHLPGAHRGRGRPPPGRRAPGRRRGCAPTARRSSSRTDSWGRSREPVDDFVVRRADGVAAYNLAVVVDDADQGVDQVVRGDDLVHTTPRQVLVQQLLDLPTPGVRARPARARAGRRAARQAPRRDHAAGPAAAPARPSAQVHRSTRRVDAAGVPPGESTRPPNRCSHGSTPTTSRIAPDASTSTPPAEARSGAVAPDVPRWVRAPPARSGRRAPARVGRRCLDPDDGKPREACGVFGVYAPGSPFRT